MLKAVLVKVMKIYQKVEEEGFDQKYIE